MTRTVIRFGQATLLCAAITIAATAAALGQAASPPLSGDGGAPLQQHNCVLKTLSACGADGSCQKVDNLKGEKLPVKVTVDFAMGIVAGVDPEGWVNATRIVSLARTQDELILHGIDDAVAWQLLIYEKNQVMSTRRTRSCRSHWRETMAPASASAIARWSRSSRRGPHRISRSRRERSARSRAR